MTINSLHKILGEAIADGHGRKKVCVRKDTFKHNLESDGCTILDVWQTFHQWVPLIDDDGGNAYRKDGSERGFSALVLVGDSYEEPRKR